MSSGRGAVATRGAVVLQLALINAHPARNVAATFGEKPWGGAGLKQKTKKGAGSQKS
ncbi:hypothetical protein [Verrucomicrobium spinosum]|uniref:hypothetical protein n=1 Tax=Verrucomicrobium spinosum TaxID=2736 RepID=UPI0012E29CA7|nr:hypothetical protein [Verrucomicrobium spinosum]